MSVSLVLAGLQFKKGQSSGFLNRCGSSRPVLRGSVSSGNSGIFDWPPVIQSRHVPPCSEEFGGKSGGKLSGPNCSSAGWFGSAGGSVIRIGSDADDLRHQQ